MAASDELVRRARSSLAIPAREPIRRLAVVTCIDARMDPLRILNASPGDVNVLRNAGGLVTEDVLRSLLISQRRLGTREILVIMHTDCGLFALDEEAERKQIEAETKQRIPFELGAFTDIEARVRASMLAIELCRYLPHRDRVGGAIYDIESMTLVRLGS